MIFDIKSCRHCGSQNLTKNGLCKKTQKQKFHCKDCDKYGTLDLQEDITPNRREEILDAYFERPSMRGIARIFHISRNTLSAWLKEEAEKQPDLSHTLTDVPSTGDVLEYDELQPHGRPRFCKKKDQKRWLWTVISRQTRKIIAFFIGDHSLASCQQLWQRIDERFRYQQSFSDFWQAYNFIFEQTGQHQLVGKESGQTNHMERWNNTIRQWVGRLTRKTLAFSKSDMFNELVIRLFIVKYNKTKSVT